LNITSALFLGANNHGHGHEHGHDHGHSHGHHQDKNHTQEAGTLLSIKAILLHVCADALNNIAVVISSVIIWKVPSSSSFDQVGGSIDKKYYADPVCTCFIAILIMASVGPLVFRSGKALLHLGHGHGGRESSGGELQPVVDTLVAAPKADGAGAGADTGVVDDKSSFSEEGKEVLTVGVLGKTVVREHEVRFP
jgi:cation efflux family protein